MANIKIDHIWNYLYILTYGIAINTKNTNMKYPLVN